MPLLCRLRCRPSAELGCRTMKRYGRAFKLPAVCVAAVFAARLPGLDAHSRARIFYIAIYYDICMNMYIYYIILYIYIYIYISGAFGDHRRGTRSWPAHALYLLFVCVRVCVCVFARAPTAQARPHPHKQAP